MKNKVTDKKKKEKKESTAVPFSEYIQGMGVLAMIIALLMGV